LVANLWSPPTRELMAKPPERNSELRRGTEPADQTVLKTLFEQARQIP